MAVLFHMGLPGAEGAGSMYILDKLISTLGPPQNLREIGSGRHLLAAIGRWRHQGACVDLSGSDTIQLVFNVSGGQVVELRWRDRFVRSEIRAGSIGIVSPGNPVSVAISGEADTVQIVITSELIEKVTGRPAPLKLPQLAICQGRLQAIAAQALVALAHPNDFSTKIVHRPWRGHSCLPCRDSSRHSSSRFRNHWDTQLNVIVRRFAGFFARPALTSSGVTLGGLSPSARRRVHALIEDRLQANSCSPPALGELADAARLSIHHFVKAFRQTEGQTPYAHVNARRIDNALMLLLQANARVDQVGDMTGFSSPSHFISAFRRHMGVTPGALRDAALFRQ